MTDWTMPSRPLSIAHRGASAYARANTLDAFAKATELGADMWEVDLRTTRDGIVVAHHDATLGNGTALSGLSMDELRRCDPDVPTLDQVLELAASSGSGIYADIKDLSATLAALEALQAHGIGRAILGAFSPDAARILAEAGCPYPRSALVPLGADPFVHAAGADVIHLCWEDMDRPQDALTVDLFRRAFAAGQRVALWHEEDPARMAAIRGKPVIGICSDRPEMVNPFRAPADWPVGIVCHRGANGIAPENTLPAMDCAFGAGFGHVEIDLRATGDGEIVAMHDGRLDRTTDGAGAVDETSWDAIRRMDAGAWFGPHFAGTRVPRLTDVLAVASRHGGQLYLELKTAPPAPVWAAVRDAGLDARCFFWSADGSLLRALRDEAPDACIMIRRQDHPSLEEALDALSPGVIEFLPDDPIEEIAALRGSQVRSMVAHMGRTSAVFDRIIGMRPDLVNLDQPFAFARHLARRSRPTQ